MRCRSPQSLFVAMTLLTVACSHATVSGLSRAASPAAGGRVAEESFFSEALGVRKHVMVYLPPSYASDSTRRFPVAYYLHGLSGAEADWVAKGNIDGTADSLFAHGTPEMIIVMPDGDDGWYTTWTHQFSYRVCADTLRVEAPDRYCVEHERYDDYVARDVVRFIDARFRTLANREHRAIGGLSMGGYGALTIALHSPDVFAAAASHSGVVSPMYTGPHPFVEPVRYGNTAEEIRPTAGGFWQRYSSFWGTDIARWREADPAHAAELLLQRKGPMPALFFDCGVEDGFIDQNRALHAELTRLGISHAYAEWPGAHTWRYWSTHVRESLGWMAGRIGR
jgi:S-formylglutathione hydrolase FrmB